MPNLAAICIEMNPVLPPIEKVKTTIWSKFEIDILSIVLNTSARLGVRLYDENSNFIESIVMVIQGQDYQNWTEDSYLVAWVNQQLHALGV